MPQSSPKPYMQYLAAAALAVTVASPLSAAADKKADASLEGFSIIKVARGLSSSDKVINLLLPYIGNHPKSLEGRPELDLSIRKHEDSLIVDLKLGGYLDDSVSGQHYRGFVIQSTKGWELLDLGVKTICARGSLSKSGKCP